MDRFYWTYETPRGFTDMIMFSDGRFLTGLTFEKSADGFRNRWDRQKQEKILQTSSWQVDGSSLMEQNNQETGSHVEQGSPEVGLLLGQNCVDTGIKPERCCVGTGIKPEQHGLETGLYVEQGSPEAGLLRGQNCVDTGKKPERCCVGTGIKPERYCVETGVKPELCGLEVTIPKGQNHLDVFLKRELLPVFEDTILWLDEYFGKAPSSGAFTGGAPSSGAFTGDVPVNSAFTGKGHWPDFVPAMKLDGLTPFRRKVMMVMLTIPYGQTMTYGEIAKQIAGQRTLEQARSGQETSMFTMQPERKWNASARAVGGAVGWNPICLIIPCHRVLGANGSITGYGGGVDNKMALLKHEGIIL